MTDHHISTPFVGESPILELQDLINPLQDLDERLQRLVECDDGFERACQEAFNPFEPLIQPATTTTMSSATSVGEENQTSTTASTPGLTWSPSTATPPPEQHGSSQDSSSMSSEEKREEEEGVEVAPRIRAQGIAWAEVDIPSKPLTLRSARKSLSKSHPTLLDPLSALESKVRKPGSRPPALHPKWQPIPLSERSAREKILSVSLEAQHPRSVIRCQVVLETRRSDWKVVKKMVRSEQDERDEGEEDDDDEVVRTLPKMPSPWLLPLSTESLISSSRKKKVQRTYELPEFRTKAVCPDCEGSGLVKCKGCQGIKADECFWCEGTGRRKGRWCEGCLGHASPMCQPCSNSGKTECNSCDGRGHAIVGFFVDVKLRAVELPTLPVEALGLQPPQVYPGSPHVQAAAREKVAQAIEKLCLQSNNKGRKGVEKTLQSSMSSSSMVSLATSHGRHSRGTRHHLTWEKSDGETTSTTSATGSGITVAVAARCAWERSIVSTLAVSRPLGAKAIERGGRIIIKHPSFDEDDEYELRLGSKLPISHFDRDSYQIRRFNLFNDGTPVEELPREEITKNGMAVPSFSSSAFGSSKSSLLFSSPRPSISGPVPGSLTSSPWSSPLRRGASASVESLSGSLGQRKATVAVAVAAARNGGKRGGTLLGHASSSEAFPNQREPAISAWPQYPRQESYASHLSSYRHQQQPLHQQWPMQQLQQRPQQFQPPFITDAPSTPSPQRITHRHPQAGSVPLIDHSPTKPGPRHVASPYDAIEYAYAQRGQIPPFEIQTPPAKPPSPVPTSSKPSSKGSRTSSSHQKASSTTSSSPSSVKSSSASSKASQPLAAHQSQQAVGPLERAYEELETQLHLRPSSDEQKESSFTSSISMREPDHPHLPSRFSNSTVASSLLSGLRPSSPSPSPSRLGRIDDRGAPDDLFFGSQQSASKSESKPPSEVPHSGRRPRSTTGPRSSYWLDYLDLTTSASSASSSHSTDESGGPFCLDYAFLDRAYGEGEEEDEEAKEGLLDRRLLTHRHDVSQGRGSQDEHSLDDEEEEGDEEEEEEDGKVQGIVHRPFGNVLAASTVAEVDAKGSERGKQRGRIDWMRVQRYEMGRAQ